MGRAAAHAIASSLGVALAGCTLMASLDSLRGGTDAGTADAADAGDTGVAADTGDAGAAEAAPPRFCADASTASILCADFEDPSITPPFTAATATGGGAFARVDGGFASDFALLLEYPQTGAGANLSRDQIPASTVVGEALEIRMRVFVERLGASTSLDMVWVEATEGTESIDVSTSGSLRFDSKPPDGGASIMDTGMSLSVGTWHDVRWVLTPMGPQTGLALSVDGTGGTPRVVSMRLVQAGPFRVRVGDISVQNTTTAWRLRVDDVTIGR